MLSRSASYVGVAVSSVALLCALLQLAISLKVRFTGFVALTSSLAICSLVYDMGFFFNLQRNHATFFYLVMFGDLAMGVWTVVISSILNRLVLTLRPVDIFGEYPYYLAAAVAVPTIITAYTMATAGYDVDVSSVGFRAFYWLRVGIVGLNAVQFAVTKRFTQRFPERVRRGELTSAQAENIRVLVRRMRYYGLVQVATRLGPCWNEFDTSTADSEASGVVAVLLSCSVGVGYFALFVHLQPAASEYLREKLVRRLCSCLLPARQDVVSARITSWGDQDFADDEDLMARISSVRRDAASTVGMEIGEVVASPVH